MAIRPPKTHEQEQALKYLVTLYNHWNMYQNAPTRPIQLRPEYVQDFNVYAEKHIMSGMTEYSAKLEYEYVAPKRVTASLTDFELKNGSVKFPISSEDHNKVLDLVMASIVNTNTNTISKNKIPTIPAPGHLIPKQGVLPGVRMAQFTPVSGVLFRQSEPKLKLTQVPAMVGMDFEEFGDDVTHYAFDCECDIGAGVLCRHIPDAFLGAKDHNYWSRNHAISGLGKKFTIQVPIFKGVFYHVMLQKQSIETWDGEQTTKVFVKPLKGLLPERFVDLTHASILGDIRSEMLGHFRSLPFFKENPLVIPCSGMTACTARNHNYGTNRTLSEWLTNGFNSPSLDEDSFNSSAFEALSPDFLKTRQGRYAATTFTRYVYGLCYVCYEHHNPMFSMSNI